MVPAFRRWETALADIFQEVDEELRRDKAAEVWARYGRYIVAAAIFVVAATAGYVGWKEYRLQQQTAYGERFAVALSLIQENRTDDALAALEGIAEDAGVGYATLARFRAAAIKAGAGDRSGAAAIYDALAKDDSVDPLYATLADLYYVMNTLETDEADALSARLEPLLAADGPWRFTARELSALLALRKGDTAAAREHYTALADDPKAPSGARARATEMLRALKQ